MKGEAMPEKNILLLRTNALIRRTRPMVQPGLGYLIRKAAITLNDEPNLILELTLIWFRTFGCRYDRRGECTMCNYGVAEHVNADRIVDFVQKALAESSHYEALYISPSGSFFDPFEVPPEARRRILELADATDCIIFACESRPEFLLDEVLSECAMILNKKRTNLNMGLESANPWILHNCLGKTIDLDNFKSAADRLYNHGIRPFANILLGAPFLTEREALDSTIQSVSWALGNGTYMCIVFPSNVKKWTLLHWLWERGLYHAPSLWSLIEVIYALGPEVCHRVSISWYAAPLSVDIPEVLYTCPGCYESVLSLLHKYRATRDFSVIEILRRSTCECRSEWRERMLTPDPLTPQERVATFYERIATEFLSENWWQANKLRILDQLVDGYTSIRWGGSKGGYIE